MRRSERSPGIALACALTFPFAGACQTLAGYDGRMARPDSIDDAGTSPIDEAGAEDAADAADAAESQVSSTQNCVALGVSCPAAAPYCSIYYDSASQHHTYACTPASDEASAPALEMTCGRAPLECADGLGCGYSWHAGYHCSKICKTNADCAPSRPFCNHPLTLAAGVGPLSLCETCDPVSQGDCGGTTDACVVRSVTTDPSCASLPATAGPLGASCARAADCRRGLACVCPSAQGIGDDCASANDGLCRQPCHAFERGAACAAASGQSSPGTCTALAAPSLYSFCIP